MRRQKTWIVTVGVLAILICGGLARPARAAEACQTRQVRRTFMQLWRTDAARSPQAWAARFAQLRHLGFHEVILQWTAYGSLLLYSDPRPGYEVQPYLGTLVHAAQQHQIQLWVGLHYDPAFWVNIQGAAPQTEAYLQRRLHDLALQLTALGAHVERADPTGTTVRGWYISDEIDDVNWQTPERRDMLLRYLQAVRRLLRDARPAWPVLISGFANGQQPPRQWAAFWHEVLQRSGIDTLLFQDGIGVEKLSFPLLEAYLAALRDRLGAAGDAFGVIVELFTLPAAGQTTTNAAAFSRIVKQLALARAYSQGPITVFAAPDHLLPERGPHAAALYTDWVRDRQGCPPPL